MPDYDILNTKTGEVENTIIYDGETHWLDENYGKGNWRLCSNIKRSIDMNDVSREAEHRIQVGTQINGSVFKTDSESINRLRQILDVYSEPAEALSSIKVVTAAGELLEFDTREMVEDYYLAAIKYRAGILTRSAELQQLDLIPDPSQDILWDLTKSLKEALAELT
ncbi:hypothetical protein [Pseudovibrio brasiliensis]|uniref:Uncharacterized protein n=1 Tax=Pseudovibrio brasiliensis TaxID=1898042 RepID=A0ABX8AVU9_9HYPH|nr:hypothetical protein [Pseudovibrio brasiliensis]QUS59183.1 hypothetical protein KGB56_26925 [Pseudovibrio brasiliensis]